MGQLYTIGHSTFPEEHLTELLQSFQVDYLLDVRSVPFSQYVPQYNANQIMHTLDRVGIQYAQMENHQHQNGGKLNLFIYDEETDAYRI